MPHLTLQLMLLLLLAFTVGCVLGCLVRSMLNTSTAMPAAESATRSVEPEHLPETAVQHDDGVVAEPEEQSAVEEPVAAEDEATPEVPETPAKQVAQNTKPAASAKRARKPAKPTSTGKPARPKGLPAARGGKPDKLQMISGVGPKLEKTLHGLGFFHFDQIAGWGGDEVAWVDEHLRYKGRIVRDEWIAQCKLLAAGDMEKFEKQYGSGTAKSKVSARKASKKTG